MINIYKIKVSDEKIQEISKVQKNCWINIVAPSTEELSEISNKLDVNEDLLKYPLDILEKPHVDIEDGQVLLILDIPILEMKNGHNIYTTVPLGIIIVNDVVITVSQYESDAINSIITATKKKMLYTKKESKFIFQVLYNISQDYIKYLSYISKDIQELERHMEKSLKNRELRCLLEIEKGMIEFNTSIKSNEAVLEIINKGNIIELSEGDREILDDTIIENKQAIEMVETCSQILNGIIDIYGAIVSNNVNSVMKFLTSVTMIIAIPTMIASFVGMNVKFPFSTDEYGFFIIIIISIVATSFVTLLLKKNDML
ncbi:MAG: magnesium transporter CorA family protein [Clostridia bacterium]|nr:magnesium transporter CorA family protein [Clostridia bacterium]